MSYKVNILKTTMNDAEKKNFVISPRQEMRCFVSRLKVDFQLRLW